MGILPTFLFPFVLHFARLPPLSRKNGDISTKFQWISDPGLVQWLPP